MKRECGGCTKCCEGWLSGSINGHSLFKGRPCFYLNTKCTIYEDRPKHPCRDFECVWLNQTEVFPEWMRPDLVNAIITRLKFHDIFYYEITEAGSTLDSKTLSWLVQWALNTGNNLRYTIDGGQNRIGSKEFLESTL
jgi:uncharacterized cysteine cluster protein YcgN (CxxCxxCC family)